MPTTNMQATLKLDFLVVGGGFAGFSAAYVLAKAGHRVRVLEKNSGVGLPAGGIRVPPNFSKLLNQWAGEELAQTAVRVVGTPWGDLTSGKRVGYLHWRPAVMKETGGDFLVMHHEDIERLLYRLATSAGATIDFGITVKSVAPGDPRPTVTLSTGQVLTADVIIGADGPASIVRRTVLGREDDAEPEGMTIFGGTVLASDMLKDPVLAKWVQEDEWPIFMGPNRSICCHPIRAKKEFALQIYWPDEDAGEPSAHESWDVFSTDAVLQYEHLCPDLRRLVQMAPQLVRSRWMKRSSGVENWSDKSKRIVLIGEAAHPWQPGGAHGPSMAVEDAVVFGALFSHLHSWDQVATFLNAFQEIRESRCNSAKSDDDSASRLVWLPPGPAMEARNADMAQQESKDWDEGDLKRDLEAFGDIFCYDATDAAEEWWVNWGRFTDSEQGRDSAHFGAESVGTNGHPGHTRVGI